MFHLYLTLAYIIPNIYVFLRIQELFISKGYKLWYTVIYLLLALIYPLSENLPSRVAFAREAFSVAAGYLLPFFLYIFLAVILFDLFILFNLLFHVIPKKQRRSFLFRFYALLSMVVLSVATVIGGAINLNTIQVSSYHITVPKRNSNLDKLRIVFAADFHIQQNTSLRFVTQFVRKVNALNPDVMLYGGDIVEGRDENKVPDEIFSALKEVKVKYGTWGVLGNHEFYGSNGEGFFYKKANITLLRDTILSIDNDFLLAGRYDEHFRQRKSVDEVLKRSSLNLPVILLDHRPTQLEEVSNTPVNIQFSGHTHNGQLFPLNYIIKSMYELSWGYKKIEHTHFFVTSGLRLWGPPVKTAGKSEIILVDVTFE